MNLNTRATGQWRKGKLPKFEPFPTPSVAVERARSKPKSVKDLYRAAMHMSQTLPGAKQ